MSNSPLVDVTILSPCCNIRNGPVRKITIHHMAAVWSAERCGESFADIARQGSSNYGIDSAGQVGLYVPEDKRAWTSNSPSNDYQAVTIEVSNDEYGGQWHVSDKALAKLVDLCVDICKRNGIERLNYTGDATGNLTRHNMFANTTCPGPYLESKFPWIAEQVNQRLEEEEPMTADEKKAFEALQAKCTDLENKITKLTDKVEPCVTSINWDAHVTGDAGGKEAVAMLHDMKDKRYFAGLDSSHYGLSKQMCRLMLIFYRMLNKICDKNNLKF